MTKHKHLKAETVNAWKYTRKASSSLCVVTWLVLKSIHCLLSAREHIHLISVILVFARHLPSHEAAWVICKMALNLQSLSLSTDIWHQWRGQYCFCWSVPYTPKIEEIYKMSKLSFFFCKLIVACRPRYYLGCKQNFPRSLVLRLLQKLKSNEDFYRLSLHDAVTMLSIVWNSVIWETTAGCSVTAGFSAYALASGHDDDDDSDDDNSVGDRQSCDI